MYPYSSFNRMQACPRRSLSILLVARVVRAHYEAGELGALLKAFSSATKQYSSTNPHHSFLTMPKPEGVKWSDACTWEVG